eukprot:TRINITY_DN100927_c0_g1_i1.p1 TRINITY_DN100927_c0_g1~~TRINITY_DN100927_c0_g1_i1.p1  ORF type:complete len:406 (-),score=62.24 TRINITY_DN100927_c0_g1_i1:119-1336(-)
MAVGIVTGDQHNMKGLDACPWPQPLLGHPLTHGVTSMLQGPGEAAKVQNRNDASQRDSGLLEDPTDLAGLPAFFQPLKGPPGLSVPKGYRSSAVPQAATQSTPAPQEVSVFAYGPHGSPQKQRASPRPVPVLPVGAVAAPSVILSYGPHGSPKRRPSGAQPARLAASPPPLSATAAPAQSVPATTTTTKQVSILSYGPHGSPKRRAAPPPGLASAAPSAPLSTTPLLSTPPKLSQTASVTVRQAAPMPSAGVILPTGALAGTPRDQASVVLSYGPHGSPKRLPKTVAVQQDPILSYGPHGSPKRRPGLSAAKTAAPEQRPSPSWDVNAAPAVVMKDLEAFVDDTLCENNEENFPKPAVVHGASSAQADTVTWLDPSKPVKKSVPNFLLQDTFGGAAAAASGLSEL